MVEKKHSWNREENEYCVEEVFKNFVIGKEYDYETVIFDIYLHFNQSIKMSSIRMKFQNIKHLLNTYQIPNTLSIAPLNHSSVDNEYAFFAIVKKYNDVLNKIKI